MKKNQYILLAIGALIIGGLSFFAGTRYQASKGSSPVGSDRGNLQAMQNGQRTGQTDGSQTGQVGQNGLQGAGGMISGEIVSQDEQSLTVKTSDGSTKIVIVADSTSYKKSVGAASSDLSVGESITVVGTSNTDGSVTAKTVTLGETAMPIGQGRPDDMPNSPMNK